MSLDAIRKAYADAEAIAQAMKALTEGDMTEIDGRAQYWAMQCSAQWSQVTDRLAKVLLYAETAALAREKANGKLRVCHQSSCPHRFTGNECMFDGTCGRREKEDGR